MASYSDGLGHAPQLWWSFNNSGIFSKIKSLVFCKARGTLACHAAPFNREYTHLSGLMQCLHGTKCTTHWSQIVQGDKCYIHAALKQDWVVPSCCDAVTCIWDNWLICLVLLTDVQKWLLTHCETWTSTLQSALRTAQSLMWVRISQSVHVCDVHM